MRVSVVDRAWPDRADPVLFCRAARRPATAPGPAPGPSLRRSSVVERAAVNRLVVGSNPTAGANSARLHSPRTLLDPVVGRVPTGPPREGLAHAGVATQAPRNGHEHQDRDPSDFWCWPRGHDKRLDSGLVECNIPSLRYIAVRKECGWSEQICPSSGASPSRRC